MTDHDEADTCACMEARSTRMRENGVVEGRLGGEQPIDALGIDALGIDALGADRVDNALQALDGAATGQDSQRAYIWRVGERRRRCRQALAWALRKRKLFNFSKNPALATEHPAPHNSLELCSAPCVSSAPKSPD